MFYSACSWCQWVQNLAFMCQSGEISNIDTHKNSHLKANGILAPVPCTTYLLFIADTHMHVDRTAGSCDLFMSPQSPTTIARPTLP